MRVLQKNKKMDKEKKHNGTLLSTAAQTVNSPNDKTIITWLLKFIAHGRVLNP